jgi:hypothetical protein
MKTNLQRKLTRFYIINPVGDRRIEQRFESRESVVVRFPESGEMAPATALDMARAGLRLETEGELPLGAEIEVAFPAAPDHIRCFGRVAWVRTVGTRREAGVAVEVWHGVVLGEESWTRYKNLGPKKDRRNRQR